MAANQVSLNSDELDLDALEKYAERFYELSSLGNDSDPHARRQLNEALLPVFELASANQLPSLFSLAVGSKKINLAALCCSPPEIGISFPNVSPGALFAKLDQQHFKGHSLRQLFKFLADTQAQPAALSVLSNEILHAYRDVDFNNVLQRNTLFILCEYVVNRFPDEKISSRLFKEIHRQAEAVGLSESSLIAVAGEVMYQTHFDNGNLVHNARFFSFMDNLFEQESNNRLTRGSLCTAICKLEQDSQARYTVGKLVQIMVASGSELDGIRLAIARHINPDYGLADSLTASLVMIDNFLPESDIGRVEAVLAESAESDPEHFSTLIKDDSLYKRMANIKGFDTGKLNLSKISLQARGAVLEEELGI